jgi:hypothetical protein
MGNPRYTDTSGLIRRFVEDVISTVAQFEEKLKSLDPAEVDFVLRVDEFVGDLSLQIAPMVYEPIFRFFEAHPSADCGAPGTLVHHVEDYFPNYVTALRQSVARTPSYNGVLMINRILNSKLSDEERTENLAVLRSAVDHDSAPETVRAMARRFLARHA